MARGVYQKTKKQLAKMKKHSPFQKGHKINQGKKYKPWKTTINMIGNTNGKGNKGKKHPKMVGQQTVLGKHWKNPPMTEAHKQKLREWKISHPTCSNKDTGIELKIEAELQRRNINYQKQVPLCKIARVDFYLPEYRIVIQCDGDYWHNKPGIPERDERQDKVLTFNGFNIFRFWEHEINESPKKCIDKITFQFFN